MWANPVLDQCQAHLRQRESFLQKPMVSLNKVDTLKSCVGELVELYSPAIVTEDGVRPENFYCASYDLICKAKPRVVIDYFNFVAGEETYVTEISKRFTDDERVRFKAYDPVGLEGLISRSHQEFSKESGLKLDGYDGLEKIIVDLAGHFVRSEMAGLGFDIKKGVDKEIVDNHARLSSSTLKQCFSISGSLEQIEHCLDMAMVYSSVGIAYDVLDRYVDVYFTPEIRKDQINELVRVTSDEFETCLALYFFDPFQTRKSTEKVKSCVMSAMSRGFKQIIDFKVGESIDPKWEYKTSQIIKLRNKGLEQCKGGAFNSNSHSTAYYEAFNKISPEEYEQDFIVCKKDIEQTLVKEVIRISIQKEKNVAGFYKDKLGQFTDEIISKHYPMCMDKLKAVGVENSPELCRNYIYSATVFRFFQDILGEMLKVQLAQQLIGVNSLEHQQAIMFAATKFNKKCEINHLSQMVRKPHMGQAEVEMNIVDCLRGSAGFVGRMLVELIIPNQIDNHPFLKNYTINLESEVVSAIGDGFGFCLDDKMKTSTSLISFQGRIDSAISSCELQSYKAVMVSVLDILLLEELTSVGLPVERAESIIAKYKLRKKSLYTKIRSALFKEALNKELSSANHTVMNDLASEIIGFMVSEQSGGMLTKSALAKVTAEVTEKFLVCSDTKSIQICEAEVKPLAVQRAIESILPYEVDKQFQKAASGVFTAKQMKSLKIPRVVSSGLRTKIGFKLVSYIVSQIAVGKNIAVIQKLPRFREGIYQILNGHKTFIDNLMYYAIQPELNKQRNAGGFKGFAAQVFIAKEAFQWKNIKNTNGGKKTEKAFRGVMQRLITQDNATLTKNDMDRLQVYVEEAVFEYNNLIGKKRSKERTSSAGDR